MRLKRSSDEFCGSVIFHVGVGAFENVYIRFVIFFYPDEGCTLLELEEKSRDVDPLKVKKWNGKCTPKTFLQTKDISMT